ncbi:hypothetical protein C8R45DRAFT_956583 [Mycena sanguinolenta]|nr:hypothetical protein C8R45DRAFT_956583 [Mycena sanguinolenta]
MDAADSLIDFGGFLSIRFSPFLSSLFDVRCRDQVPKLFFWTESSYVPLDAEYLPNLYAPLVIKRCTEQVPPAKAGQRTMSISCIPFPGNFVMLDFQGLALDLTGASNGPLTTQFLGNPPSLNQQWELVPVNNGRVLSSALSQSGEAVVIAMGADGSAFGASGTSIAFNVTCLGGLSATLVDNILGIALTAASLEGSSTPVTFEAFTGSSEQVWSLVALD